MQKDYSCFDNIVSVAGLRSTDRVLYIGGNVNFPFLKDFVSSINYVKKPDELNRLVMTNACFDKILIARENILAEDLIIKAAQMLSQTGLICFFSDDKGMREAFVEIVEKNYHTSDVWMLNSNVGPVIVTNAKGNPGWSD